MATGLYQYLKTVGAALIADATIKAFLQTNFKKTLTVIIGEDESALPSDELCPMILINGGGRSTSANFQGRPREAKMTLALKDSMENKIENVSPGLFIYPGLPLIDQFSDMVSNFLAKMPRNASGYVIAEISGGAGDLISFPTYRAFLSISIHSSSEI